MILFAQPAHAQSVNLQIPIPGLPETLAVCNGGQCSGLAQYIIAISAWLVAAVILLAVVAMMVGGFFWLTAAGARGRIQFAQNIIQGALIGLLLALSSSLLLSTISPKLVHFLPVDISTIAEIDYDMHEADVLPDTVYSGSGGSGIAFTGTRPSWTYATFDCSNRPAPAGVIDPSLTIPIPNLSHITNPNSMRMHKDVLAGIQKLNDTLARAGGNYKVEISSGYRPFANQAALWCGDTGSACSRKPPAERKKACAVPGFSNHGHGIAFDVSLLVDGRKVNPSGNYSGQCSYNREHVKKLAEFFYASDPKWKRYEGEMWHFEYDPPSSYPNRGTSASLPARCGR